MCSVLQSDSKNSISSPTLFVVGTPIGNLRDITLRALDVLQTTPLIIAEDTRVAKRLLAGVGIESTARYVSYREHSSQHDTLAVVQKIQQLGSAVYVSDAGTPLISDPGAFLVQLARQSGIQIVPIPGVSALTTMLSVSGWEMSQGIHFLGFPPAVKHRSAFFQNLQKLDGVVVLFESPHRIKSTIADLINQLGGEMLFAVGRELTKLHEQIIVKSLTEIAADLENSTIPLRGEFVLCGRVTAQSASNIDADRLFQALLPLITPRAAAKITAQMTGLSSNDLYKAWLAEKDKQGKNL